MGVQEASKKQTTELRSTLPRSSSVEYPPTRSKPNFALIVPVVAEIDKDSKEALFVRKLGSKKDATYETYRTFIDTRPADVVANIMICLIHQTNYLLDQQLRALEQAFLAEGGLRERMTRARLDARRKS